MKNQFLNIKGATLLTKKALKELHGGISKIDPTQCGCSCSGSVTGPFYCHQIMACPQVYTCAEES